MCNFLKFRIVIFSLSFFVLATNAHAYKLKCNELQSLCEVDTKRLTKGDYVAIFDENDYLIALGTIVNIKGNLREVKISRKFRNISNDSNLIRIEDTEAADPKKYFKIREKLREKSLIFETGLLNIGAGADDAFSFHVDGSLQWIMRENLYLGPRLLFANGSGKVAGKDSGMLKSAAYDLTTIGVTGQCALVLIQLEGFTVRSIVDLGFAHLSIAAPSGVKVENIHSGFGTFLGGGISSAIRLEQGWDFTASTQYWLLQGANSYSISAGVTTEI